MSRRLVDTGSKPFQSSLLITYLWLSVTIAPKKKTILTVWLFYGNIRKIKDLIIKRIQLGFAISQSEKIKSKCPLKSE